MLTTILASEVVATIDIFATELHARKAPLIHIALQSQNAWNLKFRTRAASHFSVIFDDFDFALKPEDQGALPAHHFDGLVAGVQNQGALAGEASVSVGRVGRGEIGGRGRGGSWG